MKARPGPSLTNPGGGVPPLRGKGSRPPCPGAVRKGPGAQSRRAMTRGTHVRKTMMVSTFDPEGEGMGRGGEASMGGSVPEGWKGGVCVVGAN